MLMQRPLPDQAYTREPLQENGLSGTTHDPLLFQASCAPHLHLHLAGRKAKKVANHLMTKYQKQYSPWCGRDCRKSTAYTNREL